MKSEITNLRFCSPWLRASVVQLLFAALAIAMAGKVDAAPASRPTKEIAWDSCVTGECHANIKRQPVIHGPVNTDSCDPCHELYDAKEHTFRILRQGTELCTYCHEFDTAAMPVVHEPVRKGECLGCHDPHGGRTRAILREDSEPDMCGRCHESVTLDRGVVHTPVKEGQCVACHPPHASKFPKLLDVMGPDLCIACHADFEAKMAGVKFRHKALREGCTSCHAAHASSHANQLVAAAPDLCTKCHEQVKDQALAATHRHSIVMEDDSCLACHTPHGGNHDHLMAGASAVICMECHKDPIASASVKALPQLLDASIFQHGPVRDGQCGGCHAVHGNDSPLLLTSAYELSLYQRFAPEKYELCFACHDSRLAQNTQANDVTNFRNGDVNLHYVHVNDPRKGRGCNICHDPHASGHNDRNVRDWVQYGNQRLPIGFTRTKTGGSCAKTCHPPYAYDRVDPVRQQRKQGPEQPATQPLAAPRAIDEPMLALSWIANDIGGKPVRIPNDSLPTVLVLMRPGDAANVAAARQVQGVVRDLAPGAVQVLSVSCGPLAASDAATLAQLTDDPWPIVADVDNALCGAMDVHSWPSIVLLKIDGTELARFGGAPESLAWRLDAYLKFATAKIDRAALDQQIAALAPSADAAGADDLERTVRHIDSLLREGKIERANERLREAMNANPDSTALRVLEVKILTAGNEADDTRRALVLLERLPADAIEAWERDLYRARLFSALGQWDLAKPAAQRLLDARPDLSEAHFLMGRIAEAQGDFPTAAAEYRRAMELAG